MKKPELYKKDSISNLKNRTTNPLSVDEVERVDSVISKFFTLFKDKHL